MSSDKETIKEDDKARINKEYVSEFSRIKEMKWHEAILFFLLIFIHALIEILPNYQKR